MNKIFPKLLVQNAVLFYVWVDLNLFDLWLILISICHCQECSLYYFYRGFEFNLLSICMITVCPSIDPDTINGHPLITLVYCTIYALAMCFHDMVFFFFLVSLISFTSSKTTVALSSIDINGIRLFCVHFLLCPKTAFVFFFFWYKSILPKI